MKQKRKISLMIQGQIIVKSKRCKGTKSTTNLPQGHASNAKKSTVAKKQPNEETPFLTFFRQLQAFGALASQTSHCQMMLPLIIEEHQQHEKLTQSFARLNQRVPITVQAQRNGYSSRDRIESTTTLPQKRAYLCCRPKSLKAHKFDIGKEKILHQIQLYEVPPKS